MNDESQEINSTSYNIITISIILVTIIPIILIILSYSFYKQKKSKEDVLNIEKLISRFVIIFIFLIIYVLNIIQDKGVENIFMYKFQIYVLSIGLMSFTFLDLKLNIEKYKKYLDSTYVINDFISKRAKNFNFEILTFLLSIFFSLISINYLDIEKMMNSLPIDKNDKYNRVNYSENDNKIFLEISKKYNYKNQKLNDIICYKYLISTTILVYPLCIILITINLFYSIKKLKMMKIIFLNFSHDSQISCDLKTRHTIEIFYLISPIFHLFYFLASSYLLFLYNNYPENFESNYEYYLKCVSIFYFLLQLFESVYLMFNISRTDFYKFTLGNTCFSSFYSLFLPEVFEKPTISIDSSFNNFTNIYKERAKELNSTCLYFHNNLSIPIDEVFINILDNTLNIIIATITKIFQNKQNKKTNNYFYNNKSISKESDDAEKNSKSSKKYRNKIHPHQEIPSSTGEMRNAQIKSDNNNLVFSNIDIIDERNANMSAKLTNDIDYNRIGFFSEEEYGSETENKHINSQTFDEKDIKKNEKYSVEKDQNLRTNLLLKDIKNHYQEHEFIISHIQNDFEDKKLLKLMNLLNDKENTKLQDPSVKKISSENQENTMMHDKNHVSVKEKANVDLRIKIKEYYVDEFQDILRTKKIDLKSIEKSFLSHFNSQQDNFCSLLSTNTREELFKKQDNLVFRTNDKLLNIEILNNDDDNLDEDAVKDGNLINYIKYLKNRQSTFLPHIIGVYKISINKFKELKVLITKNNIVEEVPKENYNYWQLLRVKEKNNFEMITSSKDRQSLLVSDEILIKNDSKFYMINYNDFSKILFSDLNFLRNLDADNYSLLIMYYEIGKNTPHNSNNSISQDEIKNFKEKYGRTSNISANFNNTNNNISAIRPFLESGFDNSIKNDLNIIQLTNGFESNVNDFKCRLFFLFDDVFRKKNKFSFSRICDNKHDKFEIMTRIKFVEI